MDMKRCDKGHFFDPMKFSTCPHCGVQGLEINETKPKRRTEPGLGDTRPENLASVGKELGKTVGVYQKKLGGLNPVVGWLVCVSGPDRGRDFRIHSERNFIGRSEKMEICIAGDNGISRDRHAVITYNPVKNSFRFAPGDSNGMVYVNKEDIETPVDLNAYDRIKLGETELMFVPFCGHTFTW